jgi:hypothetical protein
VVGRENKSIMILSRSYALNMLLIAVSLRRNSRSEQIQEPWLADPEFSEGRKNPPNSRPNILLTPVPLLLSSSSLLSLATPLLPPASHAHASNLYPPPCPSSSRGAHDDAKARPFVIKRTPPRDVRVLHGALRELFPICRGPLRGPTRPEQLLRARPRARASRRRVGAPCVAPRERLCHRCQDFGGHQGEGGE